MDFPDYDDTLGLNRENADFMNEQVRKFRRAIRNRKNSSEGLPTPEISEELVNYCLDKEKFHAALDFCSLWIEYYPYSSEAWNKFSQILINLERPKDALEAAKKSLSINPLDPEAMLNKTIALSNLGQNDKALLVLDKLLSMEPSNEEALFQKAVILESMEDFKEALEIFKFLSGNKDFTKDCYQEAAFCYDAMGDFEDCLEYYKKAIDEDPYDFNLWYNIGVIYSHTGKNYKAIDAYDMAVTIKDDFFSAWFNLGTAYSALGRLNEALEAFGEALRCIPDDTDTLYNMATVLADAGNFQRATEVYTKIISRHPDHVNSYLGRGICHDAMEQYDQAIADYEAGLRFSQINAELWYAKADSLYNKGKFNDSVYAYEKVLEYEPENFECWIDYGMLLLEIGDVARAEMSVTEALDINPMSADAFYALAKINAVKKERNEVITNMKRALVLDPSKGKDFMKEFPAILDEFETIKSALEDYFL